MKYVLDNVSAVTFGEPAVLENVSVLIEDGMIKKIGVIEEKAERIDMKGKWALPGIINAHMHFYSTLGRGLSIPGAVSNTFVDQLKNFWWKLDFELTEEELYYSVIFPLIQGILHGTTTVFDHHVSTKFIDGSLSLISDIMKKYGIKGALSFEVTGRNGDEVFKKEVRENVNFYEMNRDDGSVRGMLGLHANMTLSDEELKYIEKNTPDNMPIHCHLAEDREDQNFVKNLGYQSVTHRLYRYNLLRKNSLLIHGVWTDASEWEIIAKSRSFLVHNPSSNINNAVGILDIIGALKNNVVVGIGTDGMHNVPMHEYFLAHILSHYKNSNTSAGWGECFSAFKNNGKIASAILSRKTGVIEEGACADFVFFDYTEPTELTGNTLIAHILFGLVHAPATDTISDGRFLLKDRKLQLDLDLEAIGAKSREISKKLWSRVVSG